MKRKHIMRRRKPGERYTANGLFARATLGAIGATGAVIAIGVLVASEHSTSILAAGGVTLMIHLITLASIALSAGFADIQAAFSAGSYVVKLVALIAVLLALKSSESVSIEVVVGMLILTIAVSLAVTTVVLAKGPGPVIGDQ